MIQPQQFHPITRPGLYGLGNAPDGHGYGIIRNQLVRYDFLTRQILSVIRPVDKIHD